MTSRVLEVIDGLMTAFAGVTIDGSVTKAWEISYIGELEHIYVASRGGEFGTEDVATWQVEWPGLSPLSRTEDGSVDCAVTVWTGDPDAVDATIARAFAVVEDCETALRANPSLSSAVALQAKITAGGLRVSQEGEGLMVLVPFTVSFQTSV